MNTVEGEEDWSTITTASTLMVKCRDCGNEHPSIIQMDTSAFKTTKFQNKSEHCPKCGNVSTYNNKSDYFFL